MDLVCLLLRLPCTIFPTMRPRYTLAQLNHYALGSVGNFLVKAARGKPNHSDDPINLSYWIDRNFNVTDDTRILRHLNTVRAQVSEWRKDPKIDQLHEQGVDWRKKKARSLLAQSDPFYTMTRIQRWEIRLLSIFKNKDASLINFFAFAI